MSVWLKTASLRACLVASVLLVACGGTSDDRAVSASAGDIGKNGTELQAVNQALAVAETRYRANVNSADAVVQTEALAQPALVKRTGAVTPTIAPQRPGPVQHTSLELAAPSEEDLARIRQHNQRSDSTFSARAHQTGFTRSLSRMDSDEALRGGWNWNATEQGGMIAQWRIRSVEARAIRVGVLVHNLPALALLRVYEPGASQAVQLSGSQIDQVLNANVVADGDTPTARTYWMPATSGDTVVFEVELPPGVSPASLRIELPAIVHMVETALDAQAARLQAKSNCPGATPDATCTAPPAMNSVALLSFADSVGSYTCTGTLLANRGTVQQGYLLTANHCISNQTVASTLTTYWFFRSSACNGAIGNTFQVRTGGATFLYGSRDSSPSARNPNGTDTTLLDLPYAPPNGTLFAGWEYTRRNVADSQTYTGLHHPSNIQSNLGLMMLRRSDGRLSNHAVLLEDGNLYTGSDDNLPWYEVRWSSGITESGSSGSALFKDADTVNPKVIGQLFGGFSSCSAPSQPDYYGRFDIAYESGLINWLNPGYRMVFRFYNSRLGTHFFTASASERDNTRANNNSLGYEAPVFMVSPQPGNGLNPVYRFRNTTNGVHFYTISETEKTRVESTRPDMKLEGIAWYARPAASPAPGMVPIYRFFRRSAGTHFYTASVNERDNIINNLGEFFTYEGLAYHAWPLN